MKKIMISLLLIIAIFYILDGVADWFVMFHFHDFQFVESLFGGIIVALVAGFLIMIGFLIAVSLVSALLIGFGAALVGALFIGINLFWPLLLLLLLIYLISDNKRVA